MAKKQDLEPEISEKETKVQNTEDLEAPKTEKPNKDAPKPQTLRKFSKFQKGNK